MNWNLKLYARLFIISRSSSTKLIKLSCSGPKGYITFLSISL
jgi:hypothetical protein